MPRLVVTTAAALFTLASTLATPPVAVAHPKPIAPGADSAAIVAIQAQASDRRRRNPTGYYVNRQGFGNYVRGPDGSFGGYPAGSAGAQELQMNQEQKCRDAPETC